MQFGPSLEWTGHSPSSKVIAEAESAYALPVRFMRSVEAERISTMSQTLQSAIVAVGSSADAQLST
jgi:hypothetical protein